MGLQQKYPLAKYLIHWKKYFQWVGKIVLVLLENTVNVWTKIN